MTATLEPRPLQERLHRRTEIERDAERTGSSFRKHAHRIRLERCLVKPLLNAALRGCGLYERGVRNALRPVVTKIQLQFPGLPEQFDGLQILHLSDLHIDCVPELAERVAAVLDGLRPDVCLMTGDYRFDIEGACYDAWAGMRIVLSGISARHGVFGILGNHDPSEMAHALQSMDVQMLINDSAELRVGGESLWLAGIDDPYDFRCDDLEAALADVPPRAFKILLAHTPDLYRQAAESGVALYLCGHTHAGQIRLPWIGSVIQNSEAPRSFTHGQWSYREMHGYTSRGIGCSMLPVRFNCTPEIALIELRAN